MQDATTWDIGLQSVLLALVFFAALAGVGLLLVRTRATREPIDQLTSERIAEALTNARQYRELEEEFLRATKPSVVDGSLAPFTLRGGVSVRRAREVFERMARAQFLARRPKW